MNSNISDHCSWDVPPEEKRPQQSQQSLPPLEFWKSSQSMSQTVLRFAKMDFNINFSHLPSLNDLTYSIQVHFICLHFYYLNIFLIWISFNELEATFYTMLKLKWNITNNSITIPVHNSRSQYVVNFPFACAWLHFLPELTSPSIPRMCV